MWRPDDWEKIVDENSAIYFEENNWNHTFEAGADAILKALERKSPGPIKLHVTHPIDIEDTNGGSLTLKLNIKEHVMDPGLEAIKVQMGKKVDDTLAVETGDFKRGYDFGLALMSTWLDEVKATYMRKVRKVE